MLSAGQRLILFGRPGPVQILGPDLLAYWDAQRLDTITHAAGAVSSWKDIKRGYDATQATSGAKPTYSATSFNGAPGVTFDGTDDCLTSIDATMLAALPSGAAPSELWGVFSQDALAADTSARRVICYGFNSGNNSRQMGRNVSSAVVRAQGVTGDGTTKNRLGTIVNLSSRHVVRWQVGATDSILTVDGTAEGSVASVPSTTNTRLRIGASIDGSASLFHQGQIAVVLITLPLSVAKAALLQTYLLGRRRL